MKFEPNLKIKSVYDIDYKKLYQQGYRGILFDIDNTLVPNQAPADDKAKDLFKRVHEIGFKTMLISNNKSEIRVKQFATDVGAYAYEYHSRKPHKSGYIKGMEKLGTDKKTTIFIGDQIFTDIAGASRAGLYTILTSPIDKSSDEIPIKIKRIMEKPLRAQFNKKAELKKSPSDHVIYEKSRSDKEKIGLILSGGAGRGAFEIGVLNALEENGILESVTGISGTSVGALNMALCLSENTPKENWKIWEDFSGENLCDFEEAKEMGDILASVIKKKVVKSVIKDADSDEMPKVDKMPQNGKKHVGKVEMVKKGIDIYKLASQVVNECRKRKITPSLSSQKKIKEIYNGLTFDEKKLDTMDLYCAVSDVTYKSMKRAFISWKGLDKEKIGKIIRSSAGIPVIYTPHKGERKGHIMIDGGVDDKHYLCNTPIAPLYYLGYRKFIVVYLKKEDVIREQIEQENKRYGDAQICRIIPNEKFHQGKAASYLLDDEKKRENMKLGYQMVEQMLQESNEAKLLDRLPFRTYAEEKETEKEEELMQGIERRLIRGWRLVHEGETTEITSPETN